MVLEKEMQKDDIYTINEVIRQTQHIYLHLNKQAQRKIRSREHCLKLERWQGPPHASKVKQYETVL